MIRVQVIRHNKIRSWINDMILCNTKRKSNDYCLWGFGMSKSLYSTFQENIVGEI